MNLNFGGVLGALTGMVLTTAVFSKPGGNAGSGLFLFSAIAGGAIGNFLWSEKVEITPRETPRNVLFNCPNCLLAQIS